MVNAGIAHGPENEPILEQTGFRLSWGAIIAGFFVATALHIALTVLGIAIGMDAWDPGESVATLGMGLGVWTIVAALLSLFVGGMTTGRLAGVLTRGDGMLHGIVLWSLTTLLAAWMLATGVSTVANGAFGLISKTANVAASGMSSVATSTFDQIGGADASAIQGELDRALRESGNPALHPDSLVRAAERIGEQATGPASTETIAREIFAEIQGRAGQVDRNAITNIIVARTSMDRAEAERVATRVENVTQSAMQQAGTMLDTAGAFAERAAGTGSNVLSTAAWWTLLALGLSLAAAVGGVAVKARD